MKNILFCLLTLQLCADIDLPKNTKQLLVVSSHDFGSTQGSLQAYEKSHGIWQKSFEPIKVNLGRSGMAWGKGLIAFYPAQEEPVKREGDGRSPAGLFTLESFFGYEKGDYRFPYLQSTLSDLCIDDSSSPVYNTIVHSQDTGAFKSFEYMRRSDKLYKLGIVVGHNPQAVHEGGSCIFIHIQKDHNAPTSGCTALVEEKLLILMQWLDKTKEPLLLQLPEIYLPQEFR